MSSGEDTTPGPSSYTSTSWYSASTCDEVCSVRRPDHTRSPHCMLPPSHSPSLSYHSSGLASTSDIRRPSHCWRLFEDASCCPFEMSTG